MKRSDDEDAKILGYLAMILIVAALIALSPLGYIWAVNTLFGTAIPFTFSTWLAAFVLVAVFAPKGHRK